MKLTHAFNGPGLRVDRPDRVDEIGGVFSVVYRDEHCAIVDNGETGAAHGRWLIKDLADLQPIGETRMPNLILRVDRSQADRVVALTLANPSSDLIEIEPHPPRATGSPEVELVLHGADERHVEWLRDHGVSIFAHRIEEIA